MARPRGKRDRTRSLTAPSVSSMYRSVTPDLEVVRLQPLPSPFSSVRSRLSDVEDRRLYTPDTVSLPRTSRQKAKLVLQKKRTRSPSALSYLRQINQLTFRAPRYVMICVRRKIRKSVMLALRNKGKGGVKKRRYKRNEYSNVRC